MISVQVVGNPINKVIVDGHALYADFGKDLVCAGISTIVIGTINALVEINMKKPIFKVKEGHTEIEFEENNNDQIIARTMVAQLKTVAESYPKNVEIKYSHLEV